MIPMWKTEEKDKNLKNRQKRLKNRVFLPLTDPDFEFSQGSNSTNMH